MAAHFQVFVSGTSGGTSEDWKRAMNAPESALPQLTEQQKEVAQRMGIPEEEYARGVLVGKFTEQRQIERGKRLGEHIEGVLQELGSAYYALEALVREDVKARWVARITTPTAIRNVAIPLDLADDVVDSVTVQDLERLRQLILRAVGRDELINPNALT
jgi:hypothetical protein